MQSFPIKRPKSPKTLERNRTTQNAKPALYDINYSKRKWETIHEWVKLMVSSTPLKLYTNHDFVAFYRNLITPLKRT